MLLSLRLGEKNHLNQDYIDQLLETLDRTGNCFDEAWIASSYGLLSVEQCKEQAKFMKITAEKLKKHGIVPSMQISRTIGHTDTTHVCGADGIKDLSLNLITSINGVESPGIYCWNNAQFREYIKSTTSVYTEWSPEIVWVDDDVRLRGMGKSKYLCFCDNCISLFNEKYNYNYTRETLKEDFLLKRLDIRKQYIDFQTETLKDFAALISKAVKSSSPDTVMALQNGGDTMLAINAQKECLDVMKEVSGKNPAFRAGGGFYNDHTPYEMLDKAIQLNYITSRLPDYVKMRNCEIENLPFTAYGKSQEGTCLEATLYMAYGCNMASVTLMYDRDPLSFHSKMFEKLSLYKPYLQKIADQTQNTQNGGICIYQPVKSHLSYKKDDGDIRLNESSIWEPRNLLRLGLPFHASKEGNAYFLSSKACDYISDEDVEFLLKNPVITNAESLEKLFSLGYSDAIFANVEKIDDHFQSIVFEEIIEHPINNGLSLKGWADSSWNSTDTRYTISGDSIEKISDWHTYLDNQNIGCANAVVTTKYGAKWFVKSAHLCNAVLSFERRNQILNAINYISEKPLPAYINTPDQIMIIPRVNKENQVVSITILNVSITEYTNVSVVVNNPKNTEECVITDPYEKTKNAKLVSKQGSYSFTVDSIAPWKSKTIFFE